MEVIDACPWGEAAPGGSTSCGNQPANIRLINRRNENQHDRSFWLSPGGGTPKRLIIDFKNMQ